MKNTIKISVKAYVAVLNNKVEDLVTELRYPKEEIEEIASDFQNEQEECNKARWDLAKVFPKDSDEAKSLRVKRCMLCEAIMLGQTCLCYNRYGVGFVKYMEDFSPATLQKESERLNDPTFLQKAAYSNSCSSCSEPFFVKVEEILKTAGKIQEGDHYRIRKICYNCKRQKIQEEGKSPKIHKVG